MGSLVHQMKQGLINSEGGLGWYSGFTCAPNETGFN